MPIDFTAAPPPSSGQVLFSAMAGLVRPLPFADQLRLAQALQGRGVRFDQLPTHLRAIFEGVAAQLLGGR